MKDVYEEHGVTLTKTNFSNQALGGTAFKCSIEIEGERHEIDDLLYFFNEKEIETFFSHWGGPTDA
jgi:hypothetical protein